jgi:hypothetical protein
MDKHFELRVEQTTESNQKLLNRVKEETIRPFDFKNETLFRGLLLELVKENKYILILTFHHIISDGWSQGIFNHELTKCYNSYLLNQEPVLKPLLVQYKDYSVWQRGWLQGEVLDKQLSYWQQKLYETSALILPTKPRPKEQSYKGGCYQQHLSLTLLNQLNRLSRSKNATLFMVLLAAFKGMLTKVCNQTDIIIGTPIANRRVSEIEQLIGFFVNTFVLRTDWVVIQPSKNCFIE